MAITDNNKISKLKTRKIVERRNMNRNKKLIIFFSLIIFLISINFSFDHISKISVFINGEVVLFAAKAQSDANTYFIATNGSDSSIRNGDSAQPWATINYGLTKVNSGDTIKIKAGNYTFSSAININDPIRHSNITITAEDINNKPQIDFLLSPQNDRGIRIKANVKNVKISHLKLTHSNYINDCTLNDSDKYDYTYCTLIDSEVGTEGLNISNVELSLSHVGIALMEGKNVTISNNTIHHMGTCGSTGESEHGSAIAITASTASSWTEKTYIANNETYQVGEDGTICQADHLSGKWIEYLEWENNYFHNHFEDGIDLKRCRNIKIHHNNLSGNYADGIVTHPTPQESTEVEVFSNTISNNGWWGVIIDGNCDKWKIYNNLIFGNAFRQDRYTPMAVVINCLGCEFYHNTVYNNGPKGGYKGSGTVINNVFLNNGIGGWGNIYQSSLGTIDHNYIYPTSPGITGTNAITVSDPKFRNLVNNNFTLNIDSPLKDKGIDLANKGIIKDFAGVTRPQGVGFDIGAYEYVISQPTPPVYNQADINQDNKVNSSDFTALLSDWHKTSNFSNQRSDINKDGVVNLKDLSVMMRNWQP